MKTRLSFLSRPERIAACHTRRNTSHSYATLLEGTEVPTDNALQCARGDRSDRLERFTEFVDLASDSGFEMSAVSQWKELHPAFQRKDALDRFVNPAAHRGAAACRP